MHPEKTELTLKEHYWLCEALETVKPSYNIQKILEPFTGANHYRYGKKVSFAERGNKKTNK